MSVLPDGNASRLRRHVSLFMCELGISKTQGHVIIWILFGVFLELILVIGELARF